MNSPDTTKMEVLKIKAFKDKARATADLVGSFEAMFNPDQIHQRYQIRYGRLQSLNSSGREAQYIYHLPEDLSFKLIVDGTGVYEMGMAVPGPVTDVSERVDQFLTLAQRMNGTIHQPNFLILEWGKLVFSCRLARVDIRYTSFDLDGTALRAELEASFTSDQPVLKRLSQENKSSPDLTHARIVKAGDCLPLLANEVYGDARHYLNVARFNGLIHFRNLKPGQTLLFPPLDDAASAEQVS